MPLLLRNSASCNWRLQQAQPVDKVTPAVLPED